MNVQLKDITVTARDGRVSHLDQVYIRGSHVRFFIVPDMLRYVPIPDPTLASQCTHCRRSTRTISDTFLSPVMLPCSVHEASAGAVSVWRVVRPLCSVRVASAAGVKCERNHSYKASRTQSGWRSSFVFSLVRVNL